MSIPTVAVTCRAYDQQGNPVAGGTFRFKLDRTEIYNGFVAPELYEATANDQGVAVVNVFPNALGTASSQYRVQAFNADTGSKYLDVMAVVPNSACDLEDIVQLPPYPAIDQSQQALQAVQAAAAGVTADANAAAASASSAQTSATNAATSATNAANSATTAQNAANSIGNAVSEAQAAAATATTQAGIATTKAGEASTSATNAASSASSATGSAATATTKATEAANSASSASTSATNAANSATTAQNAVASIGNSVTQAQTAATTATNSATTATTKASEATASASAAATSASNAATSAGQAATSATNAAGSATTASSAATTATNASNNALTYANTATTQAQSATASASAAATSATNASNSATTAAQAQSAAETARDQTLAAFDNFDDRYLGAKSSDPTVDNDGNPLVSGALYFNTNPLNSGGGMKVYDGSVWLAAYASLSGALLAANNLSDLTNTASARTNIGLGNVENKSSATIRGEITSGNVTTALGFTPYDAANPAGYITSLALAPYLLSADAASTYQTQAGMSAYLTTASAASTYQTQSGMSAYLTTADASTTYLTQANASSTYLTQANAASTYQTQSGMSSYLTTASAASTYLTQANAASTYQTQSGMSAYLTTASAASTYLALAGGTLTGDLTFSGTGRRIVGDFSNATFANRTLFQTSTVNGNTQIGLIPNGTAVNTAFFAYNNPDPTNASTAALRVNASEAALISGITGSGTYLPLVILTGNSERVRVDTSGRVGVGMVPAASQGQLQVFGVGVAGGAPATSGSTDANQIAEFGAGSVQLSIGAYANGASWFQQRSTSDFSINYGMVLQPNGGNVGIGTATANSKLTVAGTIESTTGGVKFPDGTTQTTAASAGVTTGKAIAMALVFGG